MQLTNAAREQGQRSWRMHTRYIFAIVTALISLLIRLLLTPVLGMAGPFLLFAPAIMFSAWYGGTGPGLFATGWSCFLAIFFLVEPIHSLQVAESSDLVRLFLFALIGGQISTLSGKLLTAKSRAEAIAHQAEAVVLSLEQSEERYRLLVNTMKNYAIYTLDPAGRIVSWHAEAERLQGYRTEEILGQHFSCFYTDKERQQGKPEAELKQAAIEGKYQGEEWQVSKDGSRFWADVTITALYDRQGELRGFSKIVRDITDRKQAEEQLRRSLADLSNMKFALDQAAILATTDAKGIIQDVNDRFCEISKYNRAELVGQDHRILNSGYHDKAFFQDLWSTITQGKIWQGEIKNRAKDGSYYWVDTTIVPFLDEQGKPFQYLAIRFEITERKQVEERLKQLNNSLESQVKDRTAQLQQSLSFEATLKRITDKVRDSLDEEQILQTAVQELGEGLGVSCCNAALYDLEQRTSTICYEYSTSLFSVKGRVSQMDNYPELYQFLLQGQHRQFCNIISNPVRGRVTMLACPIVDDQEILGDLWLITDKEYGFHEPELRLVQQVANQCAIALRQARLYEESQTQVKTLERLNWLKDDFLSTVSHELRTPVSNMKMSIHLLEMTLQRGNVHNGSAPKINQYLQILKNECEREISLINDLLDLQRLEAGRQALALNTVQIQQWIQQIVQGFQERARSRQITLQTNLPPQELPPLTSDITALERILAELLNNACKYTPPEGSIWVSARIEGNMLQLSVTNLGAEIPASELSRIFDKFYRVPNADPWKQGGTGLGLALVKRLAQYLEGTVQVESGAGRTTFIVEIPNQSVLVQGGV